MKYLPWLLGPESSLWELHSSSPRDLLILASSNISRVFCKIFAAIRDDSFLMNCPSISKICVRNISTELQKAAPFSKRHPPKLCLWKLIMERLMFELCWLDVRPDMDLCDNCALIDHNLVSILSMDRKDVFSLHTSDQTSVNIYGDGNIFIIDRRLYLTKMRQWYDASAKYLGRQNFKDSKAVSWCEW